MGIFRFKKFSVVNHSSAMKVNTDGVLLGALMTITPDDHRLLDVGTGTGTIALMAAQRCSETCSDITIHAIDIDEPSAAEAAENFRTSPWTDVLTSFNTSLADFAVETSSEYDLIFSNPPYFESSLQAPEQRRNAARHTSTGMSYREIIEFSAERLSDQGRMALVLPAETENDLCRYARMNGLHLLKITRIRTVPRKTPTRIVAEFSRIRVDDPTELMLTIQDKNAYTQEYLDLMKDFYLFA